METCTGIPREIKGGDKGHIKRVCSIITGGHAAFRLARGCHCWLVPAVLKRGMAGKGSDLLGAVLVRSGGAVFPSGILFCRTAIVLGPHGLHQPFTPFNTALLNKSAVAPARKRLGIAPVRRLTLQHRGHAGPGDQNIEACEDIS